MAIRDKSQSVGFVYTNIYEIYKKAKAASNISPNSRVLRAEDLGDIKITKFQPRTLSRPAAEPAPVGAAPKLPASGNPFEDLKSNLNRLQDLHSRLRFMLKELEDLVKKK